MSSKLTRTILIAFAIGFFAMWVLEFRRAGMLESYWLLLLSVTSLLVFQFIRLKSAMNLKKKEEIPVSPKKQNLAKKTRK